MDTRGDWAKLEKVLQPADIVLGYDLEKLRRVDKVKRAEMWKKIEDSQGIFEEELVTRLPKDVRADSTSKLTLARLLLTAVAHTNGEEGTTPADFNEKELALIHDFEKYNVFDNLSVEEIVDRFARREDIYEVVKDFYQKEYSKIDTILDAPEIQRDLKLAFKKRYKDRLNKVVEGVKAYVGKYGPIIIVTQIEKRVWDSIKKSEEERSRISEGLRQRIEELAAKLKPIQEIDRKSELFETKLGNLEREMLSGGNVSDLQSLEGEKERLINSYLKFENVLAIEVEAIDQKNRELDTRLAELEKAKQEYQQQMQEEKQRVVENELKEIQALKDKLSVQEKALQEEKSSVELKRQEISDRLNQITEAAGGKSVRFITREDARQCEMDFIARFDTNMHTLPLKLDSPLENKTFEVKSWKEGSHLCFDERSTPDMPWNTRSQYIVEEKRHGLFGEKIKRIVVEAVSFNHLKEFEQYGFDARRANQAEFLGQISRLSDSAERGNYFHLIGMASPTGWEEKVEKELKSAEFAHNYISRFVSFCLVDSLTGEVTYNPADDRIINFVDFFRPEFDKQRLEKIRKFVLDRLIVENYTVFDYAVGETRERGTLVRKVFYDLEREGKGKTKYIKDVGLVLQTKA